MSEPRMPFRASTTCFAFVCELGHFGLLFVNNSFFATADIVVEVTIWKQIKQFLLLAFGVLSRVSCINNIFIFANKLRFRYGL